MSEQEKDIMREMLSEAGYSDKAIDYVISRDQIGTMEDADHATLVKGPCGDTMRIFLKLDGDKIQDAKMEVLGCPGAVASACAVIELAKGKKLEDAEKVDLEALYKEVEKLPDQKVHCAKLALRTLKKALEEIKSKQGIKEEKAGQATG